jgi:membrane fusion protein, heavy metal efflux system
MSEPNWGTWRSRPRHRAAAVSLVAMLVTSVTVGCRNSDEAKRDGGPRETRAAPSEVRAAEVKLTSEAIERARIKVEPVKEHVLVPSFRAPARVAYNEEAMAHVGTLVLGRAVELKVRLGDVVNKGDELLVVESRELGDAQSDYLQKRAAVAVSTAAVEAPKRSLERGKSLEGQAVSQAEVQRREAEYKAAQGILQNAQAALTTAEQKLQMVGMDIKAIEELGASGQLTPRYMVRAPISGTVIQREVTLGELVVPEKETLLILADLTRLWILADVPEARLQQVAKGARVRVRLATGGEQPLEGSVSLLAPNVNPNTRTVQVRIEVKNGSTPLKPGMFAEAEVFDSRAEKRKPVLAVPESAVHSLDGQTVVFVPVAGEENTFVKRVVQRGADVGGMVPILGGLMPGDELVTSGGFILKSELSKGIAGQDDND